MTRGLAIGAAGAVPAYGAFVLFGDHVVAGSATAAVCTSKRLADAAAAAGYGLFMSFGEVESSVDDDGQHPGRPKKELIESVLRDLRLHAIRFPAALGAYLAALVERRLMERETRLREALVSRLESAGVVRRPDVAAAMRRVERHRLLPGVSLEEAYADRAIAIKTQGDEVTSSISQPGMVAQMLELLEARAGERILEIGTGSGYNAALLAELVGPRGSVTTVELDAELAGRAATALRELGYDNVRVLSGDGAQIGPAVYDRIIATARSDDIAPAWWEALPDGGRMVVPLRLQNAGEYAVGFDRRGNRLESVGVWPCAFIALRGAGAEAAEGELFYRDPSERGRLAHVRRVHRVVAVRRENATMELLESADLVIARPVSLFGVTFMPS